MKLKRVLLTLAFLTALIVRFWNISTIPYPPDGDELAYGYYGWSLLHFGSDEFGNHLPSNFVSIGDYKYPGLAYLNIIPAILFGLSDITPRFWSAFLGGICVISIYYLVKRLFKDDNISIFAAWALALNPWAIIINRLGYETSIATSLTTIGFTALLYYSEVKKRKDKITLLITVLFTFFTAFFTYAAARFFIPALLGVIFISSFISSSTHYKKVGKFVLYLLIFFAILLALTLTSSRNWGRADEDLFKGINGEESNRLSELYIQAGTSQIRLPPRLTWLMHNKYRITFFNLTDRFLQHFNSSFLFTRGEAIGQRIPDMGVLLFIDIILVPLGFVALFKKYKSSNISIIFIWLVLAAIPSSLTAIEAKTVRATLLIIPFVILSATGFGYFYSLVKFNKRVMYVTILLFFASSFYALNQIFVQKPLDRPWTNQGVYKEIARSVLEIKDQYNSVAVNGNDYIYFLYYGKITPEEFLKNSSIDDSLRWNRASRLHNIYFNMPFDCPRGGKENVLYVCKGVEVPQNSKVIRHFYYPDGVPAYTFVEFYPANQMTTEKPKIPDKFHYMVQLEDKYPNGIIPDENKTLW